MIVGVYPPSLIEAAIVFGFLRHLSYSIGDEISIVLDESSVFVRLKAEGLVADIRIGDAELPPEEMEEKWYKLAREWNAGGSMTEEDKQVLYFSSKVYHKPGEIITLLEAKGFRRWAGKPIYEIH